VAICMREPKGAIKQTQNGGWLHRLGQGTGQWRRRGVVIAEVTTQHQDFTPMLADFQAAVHPQQLDDLADDLGVTAASLRRMGKPRRVVAKVEWHRGELFARVGFIVTNLGGGAAGVVWFYNGRGTAEQWIKEGKNALKWTRLSCHDFTDNQVRLQLFALAYNVGNFLRRLALPAGVRHWSLTTLRDKLIKIGAKVVSMARYVVFQMAEVAIPRKLFRAILRRIRQLRLPTAVSG